MGTTALALLGLVAFAGGAIYIRSHIYSANVIGRPVGADNSKVKAPVKKAAVAPRSPYRSTSIQCGSSPCGAAKAVSGIRFLDVDRVTPTLPLEGCDASRCNCRYQRSLFFQHP